MKKYFIRFMFCIFPAFLLGIVSAIIHPAFGVIVLVGVFFLGWGVTSPKRERGES